MTSVVKIIRYHCLTVSSTALLAENSGPDSHGCPNVTSRSQVTGGLGGGAIRSLSRL